MLEWAVVFGKYYGTSYQEIDRIISKNKKALIEIDVQGWQKAREKLKYAASIFIMPPSVDSLWERLNLRGTEDKEIVIKRFNTARKELESSHNFQYFVINDDLDKAYNQIYNFITKNIPFSLSKKEGIEHSQQLLSSFKEKIYTDKK